MRCCTLPSVHSTSTRCPTSIGRPPAPIALRWNALSGGRMARIASGGRLSRNLRFINERGAPVSTKEFVSMSPTAIHAVSTGCEGGGGGMSEMKWLHALHVARCTELYVPHCSQGQSMLSHLAAAMFE